MPADISGDAELAARRKRLKAHVARVAERPCQWGIDDCTRWAADWVEQERGIDLELPAYRGEEQARALIARAGGLLPLWAGRLARAGIFETAAPDYGDVGLVETRLGPVGLIFAHDGVGVWRAEIGAALLRPRTLLKAWSI